MTVDGAQRALAAQAPCCPPPRLRCLSLQILMSYRYHRARHAHKSTHLYASWGHGGFDWTPCLNPFPVEQFTVEQGCLSSLERPDCIASSIHFVVVGGQSGPETIQLTSVRDPYL